MPRLRRPLLIPSENENADSRVRRAVRATKRGERYPGSGRKKGQANTLTRFSRDAIIEGLSRYGSDGKGKDGLVGFVLAAVRKDIRNGVTMLGTITPKQLEATVNKTEIKYQSIAEVDADLARHGLPPTREIFQIDFVGTPAPDEAAGEPEPEILPPDREPT
jgi:hypothetical protein